MDDPRFRARRSYSPRSRLDREMDAGGSTGRVAGVLLALVVAALVLIQGLWQVTSPDAAQRILRAVLPPITDLDQTLAANLNTLREEAFGVPADAAVPVRGLPIPIEVSGEEAGSDATTLRGIVLRRMAERVYTDGAEAFRAPDATAASPGLLSSQWTLQRTLNFLTAGSHDRLRLPRLGAIGATLLLAVLTLLLLEGPNRLIGPGVSLVTGGVLAALAGLVVWGGVLLLFGSETVVDGVVRRVARDTSVTILVVAGAFGALGLVLTALGVAARRVDQAEHVRPTMRTPARRAGSGPRGGE